MGEVRKRILMTSFRFDSDLLPARVRIHGDTGTVSNESIMLYFDRVHESEEGIGIGEDYPETVGTIYVMNVFRRPGFKRGRASDVLRALTEWADKNHETLCLHATGSNAVDELTPEALRVWYGRHGFEEIDDSVMVRSPR